MTLGGASVGDYDIIGQMVRAGALETLFYQVAMRQANRCWRGGIRGEPMIGLPGNPVSALVCAMVVLVPVVRAMLGFAGAPMPQRLVKSGGAIAANNGGRAHYMRAVVRIDAGAERVFVFERQDSSLLAVMERANCLVVRLRVRMRLARANLCMLLIFKRLPFKGRGFCAYRALSCDKAHPQKPWATRR